MQTITSCNLTNDPELVLVQLSVACPSCGWIYLGSVSDLRNSMPYCSDKECVGCKTTFKARYKFSKESCKICEYKLLCLGKQVAKVDEKIIYVGLGDINWSM